MSRVLKPGGTLLIANMPSYSTAIVERPVDSDGNQKFVIDNYLTERASWVEWSGVKVCNFHRPISTYMSLLLEQGLQLTYFDEPKPYGGSEKAIVRYTRVPWCMIMEWEKKTANINT